MRKACRDDNDGWAIIALLLIAVFVAAECSAASASAQEPELPPPEVVERPCVPEVEATRRALLEHAGVRGIWFRQEVAECMVRRLELLPAYARHVHLLEERLALADQRDALRAREVALAVREADAARGVLEAAERRAREAEEEAGAWYRHPAFWTGVGAVVVIALEAVAIWAFNQLSL